MTSQWRHATETERQQGFVAICSVNETVHALPYKRLYYYTEAQLERRFSRGADVPSWWEAKSLHNAGTDIEAEWLAYLQSAEPSAGVLARLETLGSYAVTKAQNISTSIEEMKQVA